MLRSHRQDGVRDEAAPDLPAQLDFFDQRVTAAYDDSVRQPTHYSGRMSSDGALRGFARAIVHPELLRTCQKCGYSWRMPRYFARVRATTMGSRVITRNAAMAADVAVFTTCARCGSTRYSQKRIWKESDADVDGADQ
jgi:predicted nucleic-acid-binding Zn-ribbon protein